MFTKYLEELKIKTSREKKKKKKKKPITESQSKENVED